MSSCPHLLVRSGRAVVAISLADVTETMRPLPTEPLAGLPSCVRGVSVVRGRPSAVIDLASLITGAAPAAVTRLVSLRGEPPTSLAVEEVIGIRPLDTESLQKAPLGAAGVVESIGTLDGAPLLVLRAARIREQAP